MRPRLTPRVLPAQTDVGFPHYPTASHPLGRFASGRQNRGETPPSGPARRRRRRSRLRRQREMPTPRSAAKAAVRSAKEPACSKSRSIKQRNDAQKKAQQSTPSCGCCSAKRRPSFTLRCAPTRSPRKDCAIARLSGMCTAMFLPQRRWRGPRKTVLRGPIGAWGAMGNRSARTYCDRRARSTLIKPGSSIAGGTELNRR